MHNICVTIEPEKDSPDDRHSGIFPPQAMQSHPLRKTRAKEDYSFMKTDRHLPSLG